MDINPLKSLSKTLLALPLLAICGTFAACSDDDVVASAVDTKPIPATDYKDTSYHPGDNFFMYANGKYWNEHEMVYRYIDSYTNLDLPDYIGEHYAPKAALLPQTDWLNLREDIYDENYDDPADAPYAKAEIGSMIERINAAESKEAFAEAIAEVLENGGNSIFLPYLAYKEGAENPLKYVNCWTITVSVDPCNYFSRNLAPVLEQLGVDEDLAAEQDSLAKAFRQMLLNGAGSASQIRRIQAEAATMQRDRKELAQTNIRGQISTGLPQLPDLSEAQPRAQKASAQSDDRIDHMVASAMSSTEGYSNEAQDETEENFFSWLDTQSLDMLKAVSTSYLAIDYVIVSSEAAEAFYPRNPSWVRYSMMRYATQISTQLAYTESYNMQQVMFDEGTRTAYAALCEDFRAAFSARIEKLDWMSATTKAKAQEKLAAMKFFVGGPENWVTEALVKQDGTMYENMQEARQKYLLLARRIPQFDRCAADVLSLFANNDYSSTSVNAFYAPSFNYLCILPPYLTPLAFSPDNSDAYNYGVASVVGHEMTHGFDNSGAKYDKEGIRSDWWTLDDGMEFQDRCALLTECYNQLQTYPEEDPDLYCNGEKTLGENIADLGGVLIALDAYNALAARQGYYGEELQKQQRKVIEAYAERRRAKYTLEHIKRSSSDVHALARERVNGVPMNIDAWYDLYNVQPGHRLYLSPSRRAYIW